MSPIYRAVIFSFLSFFSFSYVKADLHPLTKLYLSNKGYAKSIEVKTYLVTKDQIPLLFTTGKIVQKLNKDFHEAEDIFLVVRMKNNGNRYAFGTLKCNVPNCDIPIVITVAFPHFGDDCAYHDWVIPLGSLFIFWEGKYTKITCSWDELYTY